MPSAVPAYLRKSQPCGSWVAMKLRVFGLPAESSAAANISTTAKSATGGFGRFFGGRGRRRLREEAQPVPVDVRAAHQARILFLVRGTLTSTLKPCVVPSMLIPDDHVHANTGEPRTWRRPSSSLPRP